MTETPDTSQIRPAWTGDTTGPFGGPDEQLGYLRRAITSVDTFLEEHPQFTGELSEGPCGELAAKADHLAACGAAMDVMCSDGTLPSAWRPDPRVTANGGAAAKAGWDLSGVIPDRTIGMCRVELMGHRIRVGIVSEVTLFGDPFLRIDFPQDGENLAPEFYSPKSLYGLLPVPGPGGALNAYAASEIDSNPFGEDYDRDPF